MASGQPETGLDSRRSPPLGVGRRLPSFSLLLMLLSLVFAGYFVDRANNAVSLDHLRSDVLQELSVLRARLEGQININLQSVQGLVAAIQLEPDMDQARFADHARPLVTPATQLRNIAAAPDMIVRMTYPLKGNERVIGFDLTALPEQRSSAERAARESSMVVDGPISLVQGGVGFVGRIPIRYVDQDGQERFWGLISAVIDADRLYEVVGLTAASQHLQIAMRHVGANGQLGVPFYGAAGIFVANPVLVDITLPSGSWQMAALPVGGWPERADNAWILRLAMLGLGLLILLPSLVAFWQIRKSQEQTTRLRGLFELSPIGIALNDFDTGQFIEGNAALIRPSGYSLEEFGQLSYWDLTPQEYEAQEQRQLEQLRTLGRYGPYQKEYIRKDGSRYPVELNGMLIHDASGRALIWSIVEDISARKQAERQLAESRQQLELIIDSTAVGIWDWDIPSGATQFNERWAEIIGYRLEELEPVSIATWQTYAHPEDLVHSGRLLEAHWCGETARYSCRSRMRHKQGHWVWVLDTGRVVEWLPDGRPKRMVGTHLDISEQVAIEEQLINARDAAEAAARAKSEFLATMSHEIRTPMNGVLGMLNLLQRETLTEEQRRKVRISLSSAESLLSLLNDILDFSKVDAGRLELEALDFDLRQLLGELAETMALRAQEKGLELILDVTGVEPAMVRGDPGRVRQVFTNLVGNAIKFTTAGEVLIRARLETRAGGLLLRGSVTDTGIGIPPEQIPELFQPFTQGDASTTRQYGGTGLGLAISKKICELMDGDIHATSKPGSGSCFSFTLLLQRARQAPASVPRIDLKHRHILIVDDNQTNREVLRQQLRYWGADVSEADSAAAALACCVRQLGSTPGREGKPFDLAILDRVLPGTDGAELGQALKADPRFSAMPLVMMTSVTHRGDANLFARIGFAAYFPKPVTPDDLIRALQVVLEDGAALAAAEPLVTRHYVKTLQTEPLQQPAWPDHTRLLLVEDNAVNQEVAKLMLAEMGLTVDVAADGAEALRLLANTDAKDAYTLILMDCQMPEMDGFAATQALRQGAGGPHHCAVPVIAMTANAMKGDREKCLAAGMNDYISKPVVAPTLYRKLRHWLLGETGADVEPESAAPAPVTVWDRDALLDMLKGREDRLQILVQLFADHIPERIGGLDHALSRQDAEQVVRQAHAIKGSAGQLKAVAVEQLAGALEAAAKGGDWQQIATLSLHLRDGLRELLQQMLPDSPNVVRDKSPQHR